jgi:hypothetical protein
MVMKDCIKMADDVSIRLWIPDDRHVWRDVPGFVRMVGLQLMEPAIKAVASAPWFSLIMCSTWKSIMVPRLMHCYLCNNLQQSTGLVPYMIASLELYRPVMQAAILLFFR